VSKKNHDRESNTSGGKILITAEEIHASFIKMVMSIKCPYCDEPFTDGAVEWAEAWQEGRRDLIRALDTDERDGPYKIKCEWCNERSWINYFKGEASKVEP